MKILLFGASGQLGGLLQQTLQPLGELVAPDRAGADLSDSAGIERLIEQHRPLLIVNAAAYTAVDRAESDTEQAYLVNATAPTVMAAAAKRIGALLIHYSTDYVFSGQKIGAYLESDQLGPLSVYGSSKQAGERGILKTGCDALILRTSWVYAARGKNFVHTMLNLAEQREELRIVADQYGAPTSALDLARATAAIAVKAADRIGFGSFRSGIYHLTAAGLTSWHGFAEAIVNQWCDIAPEFPLATKRITPISTSQYPTPAQRPSNSLLSNQLVKMDYQIEMPDWHDGLSQCLRDIRRDRLAATSKH